MEKAKRSWKEIVDGSNGTLKFAPEELVGPIKEWQKQRAELMKETERIAKANVQVDVLFQNLILKVREYFEGAGLPDIWTKDVGIETTALKDGEIILTVNEGRT